MKDRAIEITTFLNDKIYFENNEQLEISNFSISIYIL